MRTRKFAIKIGGVERIVSVREIDSEDSGSNAEREAELLRQFTMEQEATNNDASTEPIEEEKETVEENKEETTEEAEDDSEDSVESDS